LSLITAVYLTSFPVFLQLEGIEHRAIKVRRPQSNGFIERFDRYVLACALAARAETIVSGDDDLHTLGTYQGILVLTAAQCLQGLRT